VDYVVLVEILQTEDDAAYEELYDLLWKFLVLSYLKSKIATGHIVHNKVEVGPILEGVDHIDEKGMFKLAEKLPFVHDWCYAVFGKDSGLWYVYTDLDIYFIA
jgi:hypothetical protein